MGIIQLGSSQIDIVVRNRRLGSGFSVVFVWRRDHSQTLFSIYSGDDFIFLYSFGYHNSPEFFHDGDCKSTTVTMSPSEFQWSSILWMSLNLSGIFFIHCDEYVSCTRAYTEAFIIAPCWSTLRFRSATEWLKWWCLCEHWMFREVVSCLKCRARPCLCCWQGTPPLPRERDVFQASPRKQKLWRKTSASMWQPRNSDDLFGASVARQQV